MDDDFDLFPKRENLDPFSFGKKEKSSDSEKAEGSDELFGTEEQAPGSLPDLPIDLPADMPAASSAPPPPLQDLPLAGQEAFAVPPAAGAPPLEPPPSPVQPEPEPTPDFMDEVLSDGPISEDKTFDEPILEQEQFVEENIEKGPRKSPSPFVIVGGALIIIIGLLLRGPDLSQKRQTPGSPGPAPGGQCSCHTCPRTCSGA